MNLLAAPEFKVGLLVLIISGIIAGMSLSVSNDPSYLGSSKDAWFYIDDASGLVKRSQVNMAGIPSGTIRDIKLENGRARVEMTIQGEVPLTKSARVEIRPNGILGDKHIELVGGDPRDPPLRSGEQILVVDDRASVDRLIGEISKITKSVSTIADNIKAATEGDTEKPLGKIVHNIEVITSDLADLSSRKKEDIAKIIDNLKQTTDSINELVNDESNEGLKYAMKQAMRRVDNSLKNVEEITGKINRGEGTIGKLVNDDSTIEQVNTAVDGINNYLEAANKTQTSLDYHSHYLLEGNAAKSFLSVRIQPGLDRYYELGVVDDARGVTEKTITDTTSSGGTTTVQESKRYESKYKFNALFAKNFYDLTVKGGIIENAGGFGLEYSLLRKRLKLSVEAFDFTNLNVRSFARYNLFSGIYVTGGGENIGSKSGKASAFVGAGLFLTNDDLKLLLSKLPF